MTWSTAAGLAFMWSIAISGPAYAAGENDEPRPVASGADRVRVAAAVEAVPEIIRERLYPAEVRRESTRPMVLPVLYATLATLHGLDVYTTARQLGQGGVERNPLLQPMAGNTAGFVVVKAASTAATIVLAEKLWRRNKGAAIAAVVATNVVMAAVVANNVRHLEAR